MVATPSTMLELGTEVPDFALPDTEGRIVRPSDFQDARALLVVFMCNHCPYVKHILDRLLDFAREYVPKGLGMVGINSNDVAAYPEDAPEQMREVARAKEFPFPYLYDETQDVAKAYRAACTPDFFLFDSERKLVYRGQFDDSRPGNGLPVTGKDLEEAVRAVLDGRPVSQEQKPSVGCNIKWRPGNEPDYFG